MRKKHRKKTGGQQAFLRGFRGSFDCGPPQSTKDTKRTSTTAQNETTGKHRPTATKPSRFFASSRLHGKACPQSTSKTRRRQRSAAIKALNLLLVFPCRGEIIGR